MKGIMKDRIDVLLEKAKAGDSNAQLELAKSFYKGHLVEKSIDQAKYWVFKSASAGNEAAISLYRLLNLGIKDNKTNSFMELLGALVLFLPIAEFFLGLIGLLFINGNSTAGKISTWLFAVGLASFVFGFIPVGKLSETKYEKYALKIGISCIIIVHIVAIFIAQ